MTEPWDPNHRGMWTIMPPKDMPIEQIGMLQTTIHEAWANYGGDHRNAEQFWNHLVGNGMANVPRETSPPTDAHDALVELLRKERLQQDPPPPEAEWEAHIQEVRRRAELLNDVDVSRGTSTFQVEVIYRVNGGALRTTQRTVDAEDWSHAVRQVSDQLNAAFPKDVVSFCNFSGSAVADGGSVIADVPRETSGGDDASA